MKPRLEGASETARREFEAAEKVEEGGDRKERTVIAPALRDRYPNINSRNKSSPRTNVYRKSYLPRFPAWFGHEELIQLL